MPVRLLSGKGTKENATWADVEAVLPELREKGRVQLCITPYPEQGSYLWEVQAEEGRYRPSMLSLREGSRYFNDPAATNKGTVSIGGYYYDSASVTRDYDLIVRMIKEFYHTGTVPTAWWSPQTKTVPPDAFPCNADMPATGVPATGMELRSETGAKKNPTWAEVAAMLPELAKGTAFQLVRVPTPKVGPLSLSVQADEGNYKVTMPHAEGGGYRLHNPAAKGKARVSICGHRNDPMDITRDDELVARMVREFYHTGTVPAEWWTCRETTLLCAAVEKENPTWAEVEAVLPLLKEKALFRFTIRHHPESGRYTKEAWLEIQSDSGNYRPILTYADGTGRTFSDPAAEGKELVNILGHTCNPVNVTRDYDLIVRMIKEFYHTSNVPATWWTPQPQTASETGDARWLPCDPPSTRIDSEPEPEPASWWAITFAAVFLWFVPLPLWLPIPIRWIVCAVLIALVGLYFFGG